VFVSRSWRWTPEILEALLAKENQSLSMKTFLKAINTVIVLMFEMDLAFDSMLQPLLSVRMAQSLAH
jgi:hypothetical protein